MAYRDIPDDFRRDYFDFRGVMETGGFYDNEHGELVYHAEMSPKRAEEIQARLETIPRNIIFIQTEQGRYQITAGEQGITVTLLDPGKNLVIEPRMGNQVDIRSRLW